MLVILKINTDYAFINFSDQRTIWQSKSETNWKCMTIKSIKWSTPLSAKYYFSIPYCPTYYSLNHVQYIYHNPLFCLIFPSILCTTLTRINPVVCVVGVMVFQLGAGVFPLMENFVAILANVSAGRRLVRIDKSITPFDTRTLPSVCITRRAHQRQTSPSDGNSSKHNKRQQLRQHSIA